MVIKYACTQKTGQEDGQVLRCRDGRRQQSGTQHHSSSYYNGRRGSDCKVQEVAVDL